MRRRIAVLGGGPAGLAAGHEFVQAGHEVDLFEAADDVGGLTRSFDLWGWRVDLGSHIYAEGQPVADALWRAAIGADHHRVPLRRGVMIGNRCYRYPFVASDIVRQAPFHTLAAMPNLVAARLARRNGASDAAAYMCGRFGRPLAERYFRNYAEKLFGTPWTTLDAQFARALVAPDRPGFRASTFPYSSGGTGMIAAGLRRIIERRGARVHTNARVTRVAAARGGTAGTVTVEAAERPPQRFDHLVSTLALPVLLQCLPDVPTRVSNAAARLTTRSTVLVYLKVEGTTGFSELWRFINDPNVAVGRVANVGRWWPEAMQHRRPPETVLCAEYWCDRGDATWAAPEPDVARTCERELRDLGFVLTTSRVVAHHVVRVPATHPTPLLGVGDHVAVIEGYLAGNRDVSIVGRHASHGMGDVADVLQAGATTARSVLASW
jgi:protoporphyrinogen oxidase